MLDRSQKPFRVFFGGDRWHGGEMFIVGLTGGIATGKSTVYNIFKDLGCAVIDADEISREVVRPHQPAWKAIVKTFGKDILLPNGELDRERLGKIVFDDEVKRKLLNKCTHPAILCSMLWKVLKHFLTGERFVILDVPLLYETKSTLYLTREVIVVSCDSSTQLERLMDRNKLQEDAALQRINAQMPLSEKCKRATYVIDNSGTKERTREQAVKLYHKFKASHAYLPVRITALMCGAGLLALMSWLVVFSMHKCFDS